MADGRDESNIFFNKKDDDDGVIVREWMGPDAPTSANLLITNHQSLTLANSFTHYSKITYLPPRLKVKHLLWLEKSIL